MSKRQITYLLLAAIVLVAATLYYRGYRWQDPNVLRITSIEIAK